MVSKKIFKSPGSQILKIKTSFRRDLWSDFQDTNRLQSKELELKHFSSNFDEKLKL